MKVVSLNEQNSNYQNWIQYSYERKCKNLHIQGNKIRIAFVIVTQSIVYQPVVREPGLYTYSNCNVSVHFISQWNTVGLLFETLSGRVESRNFSHLMEPRSLLPHSKEPFTYPYPEPNRPLPPSNFLKIHSPPIPFMHFFSPHSATCPPNLILLDLITRIIFTGECRSWSSLLCGLPNHPLLEHPQLAFLPQPDTLSFIPIPQETKNFGSVYLKLRIFL